jgi:hypothetical protein
MNELEGNYDGIITNFYWTCLFIVVCAFVYLAKDPMTYYLGKFLLKMNMQDEGVYYDYSFQKGFVEKLFENLPIPQI